MPCNEQALYDEGLILVCNGTITSWMNPPRESTSINVTNEPLGAIQK